MKYISAGLFSTAELSLLEARKEVALMGKRCMRAFEFVMSMHGISKEEEFNAIFKKVEKYEGITDNMEYEIAHYLQKVSEGRLSDESKRQIQRMLREVDDLESIGDCCYNLARTLSRKRTKCKAHFTDEQSIHITEMEKLVLASLEQMVTTLQKPEGEGHDISASYEIEREINSLRTSLRDNNQCWRIRLRPWRFLYRPCERYGKTRRPRAQCSASQGTPESVISYNKIQRQGINHWGWCPA